MVPTATCPPQKFQILSSGQTTNFSQLNLAPRQNSDRARLARDLWRENCPDFRESDIRRSNNYACLIRGSTEKRIVIGTHYDKVGGGAGIADNWSGVLLTHQLLQYFLEHPPSYTLDFVAFGEEEDGMFGSSAYLDANDLHLIAAMINIDTIGLRSLLIDRKSDPVLSCKAQAISNSLGHEFGFSSWRMLTGDSEIFIAKGIPVLNIHSVDRQTIRRIHNRRDRPGNVEIRYLEETFNLLLNLLLNLEESSFKLPVE